MFRLSPIADWVVSALVLAALITDGRWRRIPNWLTVPGIALGIVHPLWGTSPAMAPWSGLMGTMTGIGLLFPLFLAGGMGGGDVKLMGAVGAWIGPWPVFSVVLLSALAGGVISLGMLLKPGGSGGIGRMWNDFLFLILARARPEPGKPGKSFPYSVAIAAGWTVYLAAGGVV